MVSGKNRLYWDMPKKKNSLKTSEELTIKQRMFVDKLVSEWGQISKVDAAKFAGYTSKNKYGPTEIASRLLNPDMNPHVVRYLEKRLQRETDKYSKDKLRAYKTYDILKDAASKKGQFTAAINAEYRKGQMAGFFVDKKEINHIGLEGMSREQLEQRLSELETKIGEGKNIINVTAEEITS